MPIPTLKVRTLAGDEVAIPAERTTIVLAAFARDQRSAAESWVPALRRIMSDRPELRVLGLAVLPSTARLMRGLIERGFRKHAPDPAYAAMVAPAFTNVPRFVAAAGLNDTSKPALLVIAPTGDVVWRHAGPWTPMVAEQLAAALSGATSAASA